MAPTTSTSRRRMVGVSLKMYLDLPSSIRYIEAVSALATTAADAHVDLFVIPDFVSLTQANEKLAGTHVMLGAQDCCSQDHGAFTGEVSPLVLRQAGVGIVEIGHAERRKMFGETDQHVAMKAAAVARHGMVPLVCIGETNKSSVASESVGMAIAECQPQVLAALSQLPDEADLVLAYEPVWAIGASEPAAADHVVAVTRYIRDLVTARRGRTRILYGGSAGLGTFAQIKDGVDGLFLGRFAHNVANLHVVITEMSA